MQRKNEILMKDIARRLKELREAKGVSQQFVYIDTDLNIGKIEVGKTNLSMNTLAILCSYYGVTLEEFFRGIEIKEC